MCEWVVNFERGSVMPHLNVTFEKRPKICEGASPADLYVGERILD